MELFLPSLFILSLTAFVVFFILPRFSPYIVFILCSIFLVFASYAHFKVYSNEYKNLMFFDIIKNSPMLLFILIVLGVLLATSNLFTGFKFKMPRITFSDNIKQISNVKNLTNISFDKIRELEKQV